MARLTFVVPPHADAKVAPRLADELRARGRAAEVADGAVRVSAPDDAALALAAGAGARLVADDVAEADRAELAALAARAKDAGLPLEARFVIGAPGESAREINARLAFAMELHEASGATPTVEIAERTERDEPARVAAEQLAKFKWTFDKRLEASGGPNKVILNATYRCNNRCTFCATGTRTQLDGNFDWQKQILREWRERGVTMLDIDGGEPTLNPNLFALVRYARALGYRTVNVTTNGRMASYEPFAEKLTRSGVTSILFSIHGPNAQIHAQNVGVAEAFDQTLAGVRNVVRVAPPGVELGSNVTVTKSNHKLLPELAELVWDLGLRWWNVQFLTPFGRATSHVSPDTQEAADIAMRVIDRWRDRMKIQVINLPFCFMPGYEEHLVGDLLKLERHMVFVNNDEVNLFDYLRERRTKKEPCHTCPHAVFCGGFYELEDVPEPKWLITPEDLLRRPSLAAT